MNMEMNAPLYVSQPCDIAQQYEQINAQVIAKASERNGKHASSSAWNLLGKRWTFLIIAQLLASSQSFQELYTHMQGISETILSERLKELEREGVLRRQVRARRPLRVTYHLTEKGAALAPVIRAMDAWSQHL
jgi:DNA-binding HxlR family transcriptional regulator